MTAEANINQFDEPEVQDWETLKAQVMLSNEKKPAATNVPGGWSSVAAAAAAASASVSSSSSPVQPLTKKPTTTSSTATTTPALDQWPAAPATTTKSPQWSNVAAASTPSPASADHGWSNVAASASTTDKEWPKAAAAASPSASVEVKKDADLGGWGSSPASSAASASATPSAWSKTPSTSAGWNTDNKKSWGSPASDKKKQSTWAADKESNISLGEWESPSKAVGGSSADDNWRAGPKKSTNASAPLSAASWDNAKLPWDDEPTTAAAAATATTAAASPMATTPIKENVKKPAVTQPPVVTSNPTTSATASKHGILSPATQPPPGMTMSNSLAAPPPGIQAPKVMPPGLSTGMASAVPAVTTPTIHTTTTSFSSVGMSSMASTPLQSASNPLQEPLPHDLDEMSSDMLLLIVKNLHRENGNLIQSVYNMQQEMGMMTSRYAEIIALARERETQTLALFESRKQTEMEEARRYVLSLEARVKQLEEQGQQQASTGTAGFGNQDLFAGYREEMAPQQQQPAQQHHHQNHHRNHSRKLWQKNTVVRCSNCGEVGHASQECKVNSVYIQEIFIILTNLLNRECVAIAVASNISLMLAH